MLCGEGIWSWEHGRASVEAGYELIFRFKSNPWVAVEGEWGKVGESQEGYSMVQASMRVVESVIEVLDYFCGSFQLQMSL